MGKQQFLGRVEAWPCGWLIVFFIKQAWAALFGGLMLAALILTKYIDRPWLGSYDWLLIMALAIQTFMLLTKLEKPAEVIVIATFHLVGLGMEIFKTSSGIGSWSYPGHAIFHVGNVPLFSGFMYAAVGSYIARAWRVFDLSFTHYPRRVYTVLLAVAIYINFFSHHYIWDFRYLLFAAVLLLYGRTWVHYTLHITHRRMPLVVGFGLIALVIWLAENIGTFTSGWLYPSQVLHWHLVGWGKLGSWWLLMIISFLMVDLLHALQSKRL